MRIEEPPFEAFPVRCGMTFTYGGLRIDPKTAQVQHVAGRPIPGLYAAGEMAGGLWVGNYASGLRHDGGRDVRTDRGHARGAGRAGRMSSRTCAERISATVLR